MTQPPHIQCPIHEIPQPALETFMPLLERLQSGDPVVTDETFEKGTLRADGRLDLCKQGAGVVGTQAVTQALQGNNVVQSLLLGTNGIGDEGAEHVAALIQQRPLRTVYLGCNLIGASGTKALVDALRVQPGVRALWLKRNPLGPEGASILAGLLRETSGLRTLDVVHTGMGDGGARELLQALAHHNQSLQYLYLSGNALTPAILPELTAVLARKDGLRGLYLSVNHLGDAGAKGVADALKHNTSLESLGLASCGIGDVGLAALMAAAARHPRLVSLDLGDAPSARTLGGARNVAGPLAHEAAFELLRRQRLLHSLHLPRMLEAPELMARTPLELRLSITGARTSSQQPSIPVHEDAADVRSVYR